MMFKTHLGLAVLLCFFLLYSLDIERPMLFSAVLLFSSLLPDIDTARSFIGRRTKPVSSLIGFAFGHRGLFHTIWIPLIGFFLLLNIEKTIAIAMLSGYLLHIFCDALSAEGLRPLYPLSGFFIRGFIRTGGKLESFILFAVVVSIGIIAARMSF